MHDSASSSRSCQRATSRVAVLAIFCGIPLLLTSTTLAQSALSKPEAAEQLQQAIAAINQGQLPRAEVVLNSMLATNPSDADALNLLGVVRAQQQRTADAEKLFRQALTFAPTHIGAHVNLGELYFTSGKSEQALQILLFAHRLAPTRADVNLRLATIFEAKGNYARSLEYLRLIPRISANGDYYQISAKVLLALKRITDARALAEEFKNSRNNDPEAQAQFALSLAKGGLRDVASDILNGANTATPHSFPILYALGVINAGAKSYESAELFLAEALQLSPNDVPTLRTLARVARARGDLEKGLAHLVQARRLAPASAGVLYEFGTIALQMDLYLDALPAFEQLHQQYPGDPGYSYALAAARLRNGEKAEALRLLRKYVAAIDILRRLIREHPDHSGAHSALGLAHREQGNYEEARVAFERAVQLNPKDLRASYQLGLLYAKLGDKEAAKKMLSRADELRGEQRQQETIVLKLIDAP